MLWGRLTLQVPDLLWTHASSPKLLQVGWVSPALRQSHTAQAGLELA